jgi:hypothetical protein
MRTGSDVPDQLPPSDSDQLDDEEEPSRIPPFAEPAPEIHQGSTATRHLCAGVYLDPAFRDLVLRKVHNDTRHRVAPSAGFDLVCVVWHAWRARVLQDVMYATVLAVLALAVVMSVPVGLTAFCLIGLWYLVPRTVRLAPGVIRLLFWAAIDEMTHRREPRGDPAALREQSLWLTLAAGGCVFLGTAVVLTAEWQQVSLAGLAVPAVLWVALAGGMAGTTAALRQLALNRVKRARQLRPSELGKRLTVIDQQQSHTFVAYPRPETDGQDRRLLYLEPPVLFPGSGSILKLPGPAVIPLVSSGPGTTADRESKVRPFRASDLVRELYGVFTEIANGPDRERLPGLEVHHRVFVAEKDLASERKFLESPPDWPDLRAIIDKPASPERHFLELRIVTDDELVTTVYARVRVQDRFLVLSLVTCALTRTIADYHVIDRHAASGKSAIVGSALRGMRDLPAEIVRSWQLLQAPVLYLRGAWAIRPDPTLVPRRRGDIATCISVREEKATPWEHAGHDSDTIIGHLKTLEERLLSTTEEFLSERNVDTSGFSDSTAVIISAQVVTLGGRPDFRNATLYNNQASPNQSPGGPQPRGGTE